ncbi:hypothetical protein NQZ68_002824 [Dissostichus eleginoides]|nr:hypothetical protein NQZ68_002824 [Dissostichus eleginoides]
MFAWLWKSELALTGTVRLVSRSVSRCDSDKGCPVPRPGWGQRQVTLNWLPAVNPTGQTPGSTGGFWEASEL